MADRKSLTPAIFAIVSLSTGLGGCLSVGPDYVGPDPMLPAKSFYGPPEPAAAVAALPSQGPAKGPVSPVDPLWWRTFRDPTLTSLVQRAAGANLDVRTASMRLAQSRFERGVTAAAALPTGNGNASYNRQQISNQGVVTLVNPLVQQLGVGAFTVPPINVWSPTFDASWELDIWGHVRRQIEAADAQMDAAEEQRRAMLVSTMAELARDYIQLRGVQAQIGILKDNIVSSEDILKLTRTRAEKGMTTGLDVENAAAQVESEKAQLPSLEDQQIELINALSLLLDSPPGALNDELIKSKPIPPVPPQVPLGIPSELARRRPDIRQAEAQLHSATANIGVAVAEFYPTVKLNGSVGANALDFKNLWKPSALQYNFGPSFAVPLFDGGRLKATLHLREAQQQEAAIAYHKTVLGAWHEVVNTLTAYQKEQQRRARLNAQVDHARQVLSLSRTRYNTGVTDFITVLDAERTLLGAQQQYAQSTTNVSTDLVALYKALGGGWEMVFPDKDAPTLATPEMTASVAPAPAAQ
ncbi:efflux transporter outer membrane subunit [Beijerinckia indica]|uniref:RND efflux system, outer membrane lipoprotein, NodT family n=1 Tax=Beijerinckia indica subsp. indica (strain ATCC 9039 / DSM 1715 / NCIMB 8712) TaxID=395963 RepID=B2IF81_BEII9|nr:efflux transporter outer membrane subunit [Beijerinckia indica]ACB95646.1 RND efflux system, outer membrane lipoprotein, NodT family [Beijerinckia indica subsp. indica ATCC 9039]